MSNPVVAGSKLTKAQSEFIEELAALLVQWNMSITAARLYGYLQLKEEPVSLDEIAADLEVSKSHVCTAALTLESHGNIRRLGERGSRRIFYVAGNDPGTPLRKQIDLLGKMSALIGRRKDSVAEGAARGRLDRLGDFHAELRDAMDGVASAGKYADPE